MKASKFRLILTLSATLMLEACGPSTSTSQAQSVQTGGAPSTLTFKALNVGPRVVVGRGAPPTSLFSPNGEIIASVLTAGAGTKVPISVKLIAMADGRVFSVLSRDVNTTTDTSTDFKFPHTGPWPIGRYIVEARVSDQLWATQPIEVTNNLPPSVPQPK